MLAEEEGEDAELDALASERDEKTFLLDEALRLRVEVRESGDKVIAWKDLSGDNGDLYEFVCDSSVPVSQVHQFLAVAQQCQYERKYRRPHTIATDDDLEEFLFHEEHPIPPASPLHTPTLNRSLDDSVEDMFFSKTSANTGAKRSAQPAEPVVPATPARVDEVGTAPEATEIYAVQPAELHLFDPQPGHFALVDDAVVATVSEVGTWKYWLQINGQEKAWVGIPVEAEMNPVFDFGYLSFIFNHFGADGTARSWLLRFKTQPSLEKIQEGIMQAIWEQLNQTKWKKMQEKEREYVLDAFGDLNMDDVTEEEEEEAAKEDLEEDSESDQEAVRNEEYDSDEEHDNTDVKGKGKDADVNSQLAVGYKHDRSFVVRGSKIGVFKHTPNNHLEFSTNISKVQTPGGKLMNPKKVMLHSEDKDLVLQNHGDPNKLYRMDLEYGKVVDEWNIHDDIPVVNFAPENKFAQMTGEKTFLGVSNNALFRVDPRLSGQKLVDSDLKQYASKNDFSALSTTEKGFIAVASNKGDIRLFDRLGIRAKTTLPALGDPIIGMDVSANGRWILGTTKNYILLIDAEQKDGKNAGKLGFEKPFAADAKPKPRRLTLTPEHVAQFFHETGKHINFTPAKFNTGVDGTEETSIITATGPYIVEWNLKRTIRGLQTPYKIKRYQEEVKADDFKFGSDKNVIVALPNEVNMVAKQTFKKPTRESIMGDPRLSTPRRSSGRIGNKDSGRYKLGRNDIVDSPY